MSTMVCKITIIYIYYSYNVPDFQRERANYVYHPLTNEYIHKDAFKKSPINLKDNCKYKYIIS